MGEESFYAEGMGPPSIPMQIAIAYIRELKKRTERLRLLAIIARHQLPPPSRQGINQRDLSDAIQRCETYGDLDGPVSWGDEDQAASAGEG